MGLPLPFLPPAGGLPLRGVTVLAVEDSRFASDALRLMCRRTGARLRRAEDLASAHAHLRVYRPDVVIVDLGLPDGRGEALIHALARGELPGQVRPPDGPLILGTSGHAEGRAAALRAGAADFLAKPLGGIEAFMKLLSPRAKPGAQIQAMSLGEGGADPSTPTEDGADLLALRDDLLKAAQILGGESSAQVQRWLADFLAGLARQSGDAALAQASVQMQEGGSRFTPIAALLRARIAEASAFSPAPPR